MCNVLNTWCINIKLCRYSIRPIPKHKTVSNLVDYDPRHADPKAGHLCNIGKWGNLFLHIEQFLLTMLITQKERGLADQYNPGNLVWPKSCNCIIKAPWFDQQWNSHIPSHTSKWCTYLIDTWSFGRERVHNSVRCYSTLQGLHTHTELIMTRISHGFMNHYICKSKLIHQLILGLFMVRCINKEKTMTTKITLL